MTRKITKIIALLLLACICVASFAACEKKKKDESTTEPAATEPTVVKADSQNLTVCVGPDPETLDPALNASVDGAIITTNAFAGLYGYKAGADGKIEMVPECAQAIVTPTAIEGGKYQYVITLKEGLKWSDGTAMKASDFTFSWQRAADPETAADYCYMFDVIDGFSYEVGECNLNVTADDEAGTITIVTAAYCSYFDQLLAFPTYFPVRADIVADDAWATSPAT